MNNTTYTFNVHDGIAVQQDYLKKWKKVLQTWAYNELAAHCQWKNSQLPSNATGYDVFRGQELDGYIVTTLMNQKKQF